MTTITDSIRDRYLQFCPNTDPGKHINLYNTLPTALDALCDLIPKQLVHPWGDSQQPQGRSYDPRANQKIETILEALSYLNPTGLTMERTVNERVIAGCRENALLLTSMLRYQGIPARARAGWCQYISSKAEFYADHWITEVWHEADHRWMMVDTNPKMIDFSPNTFKFAGRVWLELRRGQAIPNQYRQQAEWFYIKLNFGHDFNAILGGGPHYWEAPPLFHQTNEQMTEADLRLLDKLANLLQRPEQNFAQLLSLRNAHPQLQGLQSAWPIFAQTVYKDCSNN